MTTSRWKLRLQSRGDLVHLVLEDRGNVVGSVGMSWVSYEALSREIVKRLLELARESLVKSLGPTIWQDALRVSQESDELAKKRLAELEINQSRLNAWADMLAKAFAQEMVGLLPGGGG